MYGNVTIYIAANKLEKGKSMDVCYDSAAAMRFQSWWNWSMNLKKPIAKGILSVNFYLE